MSRRVLGLMMATSLLGLALPGRARAIDLSGVYVSRLEVLNVPCSLTFAQTATVITVGGSCSLGSTYTFDLAGTVDPSTGAFVASGRLIGLCDTPGSVTMSGTGDGETFTASANCLTITSAVSGTKCGNGVVDATEDCEDGNTTAGDCCSPVCRFDVADTGCGTDANACTRDVCDGMGHCIHPANPAASGGPCTPDGNPCTDDVCDGAGLCTHPPNTTPCDDSNACTTADVCASGACIGGPIAPECVGSIDLTGEWYVAATSAGGAFGPTIHRFQQSGAVLTSAAPGGSSGVGTVNPATGAFEARTPFTFLFVPCLEIVTGTASADAQIFTGERVADCGLEGTFGPFAVTGRRCTPEAPCPGPCVPVGVSCTVPDAGTRLTIRVRRSQTSTRWRWRDRGSPASFGDPTTSADYRLCLDTPAGGFVETAPHGSGWRASGNGFRYSAPTGTIRRLLLTATPRAVRLAASLVSTSPPALPLATPVRVWLVRTGPTAACFEAAFASPIANTVSSFRATE